MGYMDFMEAYILHENSNFAKDFFLRQPLDFFFFLVRFFSFLSTEKRKKMNKKQ